MILSVYFKVVRVFYVELDYDKVVDWTVIMARLIPAGRSALCYYWLGFLTIVINQCLLWILHLVLFVSCLQAGIYWVQLLDYYVPTWSLILVAFFECMAIAWVYGKLSFLILNIWPLNLWFSLYPFFRRGQLSGQCQMDGAILPRALHALESAMEILLSHLAHG